MQEQEEYELQLDKVMQELHCFFETNKFAKQGKFEENLGLCAKAFSKSQILMSMSKLLKESMKL